MDYMTIINYAYNIAMVELTLNNCFAYDWNRSLDLKDINSSKLIRPLFSEHNHRRNPTQKIIIPFFSENFFVYISFM